MSHLCVASSNLALPTVLRSVFRTEFASKLHPHDHINLFSTSRTLSSLRSKTERHFSSLPRLQNSQSGQQSASRDGSSTISDIASLSQPKRIAENSSSNATIEDGDKPTLTGTDSPAKKRSNNYRDSMGPKPKKKIEKWQIQKEVLKKKFKEGWNPPKKLSPDALEGIRHLHAISPDKFTTPVLAEQFKVSPEAIRRILRSKWQASAAEMEDRRKRWDRRHDRIWSQMAELGLRPPRKRSDRFADSKILYDNHDQDGKP